MSISFSSNKDVIEITIFTTDLSSSYRVENPVPSFSGVFIEPESSNKVQFQNLLEYVTFQ